MPASFKFGFVDCGAHQFLALALAIIGAVLIVLHPVFDYDLYWHLAYGREMSRLGAVVSVESFSFTAPGVSFTNREWLAQWIFYLIWDVGGWGGLLAFKLAVTVLVVTLVFRTAMALGSTPGVAAIVSALAVLAGLFRYIERPELFTLSFMALLGYLVAGWQRRQLDPRWLYLIPPVMLVWDWLHGAIYGVVLLLIVGTVQNFLSRTSVRRDEPPLLHFNLACVVALALMAYNPYGLRTYGEFFGHLDSLRGVAVNNMEYRSPIGREYLAYWVLLGGLLISAVLVPRRFPPAQAVLLMAFGILACRISRAIGVFALLAAPLVAAQLSAAITTGGIRTRVAQLSAIVLLVFTIADAVSIKFVGPARPQSIGWKVDEQYLPAGGVRFVIDKGLDGPFFNTGHIGGYLAWKLYPERRVFQYNHGAIFGDTYRYVGNPSLLDGYGLRYAFVASPDELSRLFPNSGWARIYRDPGGVLVVRRSPEFATLISRYETRLFHPMMPAADLDRTAAGQLPRLLDEMAVYLAYRNDDAVARQWLRLATRDPRAVAAMAMPDELNRAAQRHSVLASFLRGAIPAAGPDR